MTFSAWFQLSLQAHWDHSPPHWNGNSCIGVPISSSCWERRGRPLPREDCGPMAALTSETYLLPPRTSARLTSKFPMTYSQCLPLSAPWNNTLGSLHPRGLWNVLQVNERIPWECVKTYQDTGYWTLVLTVCCSHVSFHGTRRKILSSIPLLS